MMMYQAYQAQADLMWPLRAWASASLPLLQDPRFSDAARRTGKQVAAACQLLKLAEVRHKRPPWNITMVEATGAEQASAEAVTEEIIATTPFATLLRFRKDTTAVQPRVLIVAPMSGHFATLLRETVRTMLADHDVFVTDWHNVRDVPLAAGRFGLDEYTQHIIDFLGAIGPGAHLLAVCQPCVSALAAVAVMSEDGDPATPLSLTLMAGPVDCRINPTAVNALAASKPIEWFEKNLITHVPWRHGGGGRRVYPGFVQLSAFMSMNKDRHVNAFKEYYQHLLEGEFDKAEITRTFYEEYMAVADLSADFYLETVERVFQRHDLPRGELRFGDRTIDPSAIRQTALLTIEGERDDICAVGQTLAAQDLCTNLRPYMRTHYVQAGVGHYGVFSGRRWHTQIYPVVRRVIQVSS